MNSGRTQLGENDLKEPKKKKIRPGTVLKDPYPIIFWNKLGIPPCSDLWPTYTGIFDGESVLVEDPEDMNEIYTMGYFGKRMLHRRGHEPNIGDIPVVRERQWKRRVEWAAESGYILVPPEGDSQYGASPRSDSHGEVISDIVPASVKIEAHEEESQNLGCDQVNCSTVNSETRNYPKIRDQADTGNTNSDKDVNTGQSEDRGGNLECHDCVMPIANCSAVEKDKRATNEKSGEGEGMDRYEDTEGKWRAGGDGADNNLNDKANMKHSGSEKVEQQLKSMEEGKDKYVVEDRLQSEFDNESKKKDLKYGRNGNCEESENLDASISEKPRELRNKVGETKVTISTGEGNTNVRTKDISETSSKEVHAKNVEGYAMERGEGGKGTNCKRGEESKQDREKVTVRKPSETLTVGGTSENGSNEREELKESEKGEESAMVCENNEIDEAKRGEEEKNSGEEIEVVKGKDAGKEMEVVKGKGVGEGYKCDEEKTVPSISGEESLQTRDGEEKDLDKEMESEKKESSSVQNGNLINRETEVSSLINNDSDVKEVGTVDKGKKEVISNGNKAKNKQVEEGKSVSNIDDGSQNIDKIIVEEKEACEEDEQERKGGNEKKDDSVLNNSGKSEMGIVDDETKDLEVTESYSSKVDRRYEEVSQKRSAEEMCSSNVTEEMGTAEKRDADSNGNENLAKRMKISEMIVDGIKDIDKKVASGSGGSTKNADKENKLAVESPVAGKTGESEESQDMENKDSSEGSRSVLKECAHRVNIENTDYEVVEIEDERTAGDGRTSLTDGSSSKEKQAEENFKSTQSTDSDDDIMEVSMEEEEIREIRHDGTLTERKNGSNVGIVNKKGEAVVQNKEVEKTSRFHRVLGEIQKSLPSDIEVMEIDGRESLSEIERGKTSNVYKGNMETVEEHEDDDIIEINLQKSDMMELESCVEDEGMECNNSNYIKCLQRRMRKESSGFKRMERGVQHSDQFSEDEMGIKYEEREETEERQSLMSHVKLESDCDVSPCIVIPDTDSEDENSEARGFPRLESDPSVYLPSLDVLRLLPEEAFFLAYGLGCLQVWDVRNVEIETSMYGENTRDLAQSDESLSDGENSNPAPSCSVKRERRDINDTSSELNMVKKENTQKNSNCEGLDSEFISKSSGGILSRPVSFKKENEEIEMEHLSRMTTESSENSLLESISLKKENEGNSDSVEHTSKSCSDQSKDSSTKSVNKNNDDGGSDSLKLCKDSCKETLTESVSVINKGGSSDSESFKEGSQENIMVKRMNEGESSGSLNILCINSSDHTPVSTKKVVKGLNVKVSDSTISMPYVNNLDELTDKKDNYEQKETITNRNFNSKNKNKRKASHVRENGAIVDSAITVIDLADSPPSRQWAIRGGWTASDDEEEIVAMDTNNPEVLDSQPSVGEIVNSTSETLNGVNKDPMSLLDLWNAFRSSRAATSSSATSFETSYAVYHHFRAKRWVVKPGIRFGGDFLLYKDGPPFYHASYLVLIDSSGCREKSRLTWNTLVGRNRLAENIAKELMLCRVEWPHSITEEELRSPKCLAGLTVQEILIRRWISIKERDGDEEEFQPDNDDFIPLEL